MTLKRFINFEGTLKLAILTFIGDELLDKRIRRVLEGLKKRGGPDMDIYRITATISPGWLWHKNRCKITLNVKHLDELFKVKQNIYAESFYETL